MRRPVSAVLLATSLAVSLAACGDPPMGQAEGASSVPADAPVSVDPADDYAGDFDLVGTEPFWIGRIRADVLVLERLEGAPVRLANPGVRLDGEQAVWDAEGAGETGPSHRLVMRLTPQPCSDGMSDRTFTHVAEARIDGVTLKGCAMRPNEARTP